MSSINTVMWLLLACIITIQVCKSSSSVDKTFVLPSISLNTYLNGDTETKNSIARKFNDIMRNIGFFYLVDHGVPSNYMQDFYNIGDAFFNNSLEYKMQYYNGSYDAPGFHSYGSEVAANNNNKTGVNVNSDGYTANNKPDLLENYIMYYFNTRNFTEAMKKFPIELQNKVILDNYHLSLREVVRNIHLIASHALNITEGTNMFEDIYYSREPLMFRTRFNYYFNQNYYDENVEDQDEEDDDDDDRIRFGAHEDWLGYTILYQDEVGGLEIFYNDKWRSVPYLENSFVINNGEFIKFITNGYWKAPIHRVNNNNMMYNSKRLSIGLFTCPNINVMIKPIENCNVCNKDPFKYKIQTIKEHIINRFSRTTNKNVVVHEEL